ncbi:MAG: MoaD/ThiS family protein [Deltaproteobacteria bacterium]|nr:MoaD/ThiS family protein [Deltaproteobacteria bacterium]
MAETVTIHVKLFATLKKHLPPGEEGVSLTLPTGSTVLDVIDALKIPHEQATMLVAGDTYVEKTTPLTDGLQLSIFPPLAGGSTSR